MSTLYLFAQIHNVRQLNKIKPELMGSIERSLLGLLTSRGLEAVRGDSLRAGAGSAFGGLEGGRAEPIHIEPGQHLFSFRVSREKDPGSFVDAIFAARRLLNSHRDELMGFVLYIDSSPVDSVESVLREVKRQLLSVDMEEALLVSEASAQELQPFMRMRHGRNLWIVDDQAARTLPPIGEAAQFCRHPEIFEPMLETLDAYWSDAWEPGLVFIHGAATSGMSQNLQFCIEKTLGMEQQSSCLSLYPSFLSHAPYAPFLNSMNNWDLDSVPVYLSRNERISWNERIGVIKAMLGEAGRDYCADSSDRDLLMMYGLFTQSFVRRMEELLLPAMLVCTDLHRFSQQSVRFIATLCDRFLSSQVLLPVTLSQNAQLPDELRNFPHVKVDVAGLSNAAVDELGGRFLADFPAEQRSVDYIRSRSDGNIESMFYLFYNLRVEKQLGEDAPADVPGIPDSLRELSRRVRSLTPDEQSVLYASTLCCEILPVDRFITLLDVIDISPLRASEIVRTLVGMGMLRGENSICPTVAELGIILSVSLGRSAADVRHRISDGLLRRWVAGEIMISLRLFEVIHDAVLIAEEAAVYRALIRGLLDRRELETAASLLYESCPYTTAPGGNQENRAVAAMLLALRLRLALLSGDRRRAEMTYLQAEEIDPEAPSVEIGDLYLQEARYALIQADHVTALNLIKRTILIYQDAGESEGLACAHTEFGLLTLKSGQLLDAREYFAISVKNIDPEQHAHSYVRSQSFDLAAAFVFGSLTFVLERGGQVSSVAKGAGMRAWPLYHQLIRVRTLFDLGRYEEAGLEVEHALSDARLSENESATSVLYAWLGRSLAYTSRTERALETLFGLPVRRETLFFRAEALVLAERYEEALLLLDEAIVTSEQHEPRSDEGIRWIDGFSDVEDLVFGQSDSGNVLMHLATAFHGYVLARLGHRIEAIAELHRLTREEQISAFDPYSHLYFYLYSAILPDARDVDRDPSFEDRLTVLGKAVRNMQGRLSRNDRYDDKISYQRHNYWNRRLFDEARKHNLL